MPQCESWISKFYLFFKGPDLSLLGSKFAAKGASIAFHKDDHALAAVERRGMSLNTGTLNTISIDKYEVINYYSQVPIKQRGPNKRVGWIFYLNFLNK